MSNNKAIKVVFFHRKPWPEKNFSIESQFDFLRENLPSDIHPEVKVMQFFSKGILKRLYIMVEALLSQGQVNHITGDINFIALLLPRRRTVLTIHDLGFMNHRNPVARFILKWLWIKLPVWRCGIITTVSEKTKAELLRYVDINPSKIHVIYVPISPRFVTAPKVFNREEPVILQIGTKYNKNVKRLLQALEGVRCRLELIGKADRSLLIQLESSKIKYRISVNLSDKEMQQMYIDADVVSFISTNEGFGMPIVEANATGRVVVTSNISSMPEVAGQAAHLVNPFDVASIRTGIQKVIEDTDYRESLIARGLLNRQRFNVEGIAEKYAMVYRSLAREGN